MAIGNHLRAHRRVAGLFAPRLREGEEEPLVAGESVDHRRGLAAERLVISEIGHGESGDVGDVLAQRLLAVDVQAGQRLVGVVLRRQLLRGRLEVRLVGRRPPVGQLAAGVELGAGIVEAVADLVTDHGADRAVVGGRVGLGVEERRLENRRRKIQRVLQRQIHRVDRLRRHPPFVAIDRRAEFCLLVLVFVRLGAQTVADRVVCFDGEIGVIAPGFRIAHADMGGGDLGFGLGLGRRRHPGQLVHAAVERGQDIADHLLHFSLGRGGKVLLDVELADRIAQVPIHRAERELPALALRRRSLQCVAIEFEAGIGIRLRQQVGDMVDGVKGEKCLPGLQRLAAHQRRFGGDSGGLPDHDLLLAIQPRGLEIGSPVQAGSLAGKVGQ